MTREVKNGKMAFRGGQCGRRDHRVWQVVPGTKCDVVWANKIWLDSIWLLVDVACRGVAPPLRGDVVSWYCDWQHVRFVRQHAAGTLTDHRIAGGRRRSLEPRQGKSANKSQSVGRRSKNHARSPPFRRGHHEDTAGWQSERRLITGGGFSLRAMPSVLWRCWLGGRKGIQPVKNWAVGCWRGYLPGVRCRLAYGPADATATHCLLLQ